MNKQARAIIEALRSGVPSKAVGSYFSEARPALLKRIHDALSAVASEGKSGGMVIVGKYGEGKTHLLNAVDVYASSANMVVSHICLGRESPMDKLPVIYSKIMASTYLPGHTLPGFTNELNSLTLNSALAKEMLLFATTKLETNKLYYVLDAFLRSDNAEDRYRLLSDMQGDLMPNSTLRMMAKAVCPDKVRFNIPFAKSKHMKDYFLFMSHLFRSLGYDGWVILFDETELMGRMSKKARMLSYANIYDFLYPNKKLESTYSLFALSASYEEDVIEGKSEYENAAMLFPDDRRIKVALDALKRGVKLLPLTKEEMHVVFEKLIDFHEKAYDWKSPISADELLKEATSAGFLLRTRIRYAIECLDQLFQYGDEGTSKVEELEKESFVEDDASPDEE